MRQAGEVVYADILKLPDGKSKGCGVVEYATAQEAREAVERLSNQFLNGRQVYVREDRESESRFGAGGSGGTGGPARGGPAGPLRVAPLAGGAANYGGRGFVSIFVGNLPYTAVWQDVKDLFRQAGNVVRADIQLNFEGRSKGCGTVVFETEDDAQNAIRMFNGYDFQGRPLEVREDRFAGGPPPGRGGAGSGGAGAGYYNAPPPAFSNRAPTGYRPSGFTDGAGPNGPPSDTIFVSNLPWSTTNQDLVELFITVGNVMQAEIIFLPDGRSAGTGVVRFDSQLAADAAIERFQGYNYGKRDLVLSYVRYR
jgi:RNA recognition motif-containing protein